MASARLVTAAMALASVAAVAPAVAAGHAKQATGPSPYSHPPFHCTVHHFGNGKAPKPAKTKSDPLCLDYNKRDITADNGGAIRFLEAEPARFAVAGKCDYWQQDHWSVQLDRGFGPIARWDGSYWWDIPDGLGAGILRHFRIAGQPVGPTQAAKAIATVSPALAKQIRRYGAGRRGGGGATFTLPSGATCSSSIG